MIKFRPQRGTLISSLEETVEFPNFDALFHHLQQMIHWKEFGPQAVSIEKYHNQRLDERTGWNTYLVSVEGQGVGFTDGPVD